MAVVLQVQATLALRRETTETSVSISIIRAIWGQSLNWCFRQKIQPSQSKSWIVKHCPPRACTLISLQSKFCLNAADLVAPTSVPPPTIKKPKTKPSVQTDNCKVSPCHQVTFKLQYNQKFCQLCKYLVISLFKGKTFKKAKNTIFLHLLRRWISRKSTSQPEFGSPAPT